MPSSSLSADFGFNTQPPEGGWVKFYGEELDLMVSTHSRPKAAAEGIAGIKGRLKVSTHSRPKAAGGAPPPRSHPARFNTQPPEGGCFLDI